MNLKKYCLRSILLKKWELLEVINTSPCSFILLFRENTFNPFDSVPLATLRFETTWYQKSMILQNLLQNKQRNV